MAGFKRLHDSQQVGEEHLDVDLQATAALVQEVNYDAFNPFNPYKPTISALFVHVYAL